MRSSNLRTEERAEQPVWLFNTPTESVTVISLNVNRFSTLGIYRASPWTMVWTSRHDKTNGKEYLLLVSCYSFDSNTWRVPNSTNLMVISFSSPPPVPLFIPHHFKDFFLLFVFLYFLFSFFLEQMCFCYHFLYSFKDFWCFACWFVHGFPRIFLRIFKNIFQICFSTVTLFKLLGKLGY